MAIFGIHAIVFCLLLPCLAESAAMKDLSEAAPALEWHYGGGHLGPANWFSISPEHCAEGLQSPINIVGKDSKEMNFDFFKPIGFTNEDMPANANLKVENNGHSVELYIVGDFFIEGGGLAGKRYKVEQLHFHWGHRHSPGSEHTVNGKRYDAEMHLVTYDVQYPSLGIAKDHTDGVAVLAALIKIGVNHHYNGSVFQRFIDGVKTVNFKGDVHMFQASDLPLRGFLPDNIDWFYRYRGSFTTPPCDSHVVWTVWEQAIILPMSALEVLYQINLNEETDGHPIKLRDNFRPVQVSTDRDVFHSHRNNW